MAGSATRRAPSDRSRSNEPRRFRWPPAALAAASFRRGRVAGGRSSALIRGPVTVLARHGFWHGFGGQLADFGGPVGRPHRGVEVGVSHVHAEERTEQAEYPEYHSIDFRGQLYAWVVFLGAFFSTATGEGRVREEHRIDYHGRALTRIAASRPRLRAAHLERHEPLGLVGALRWRRAGRGPPNGRLAPSPYPTQPPSLETGWTCGVRTRGMCGPCRATKS